MRNSTTQSYISPGDGNDTVLTPSEFVSIQFLYTGSYSIGPLARNFVELISAIHHHQAPPRTNWIIRKPRIKFSATVILSSCCDASDSSYIFEQVNCMHPLSLRGISWNLRSTKPKRVRMAHATHILTSCPEYDVDP